MQSQGQPRSRKKRQATVDLLEQRTRAIADAVNERDFSLDFPVWSNVVSGPLVYSTMSGREFDLPSLLVFLKEVTDKAPAYHLEFLGLTTRINSTLDRAEVSVRAELLGDPLGVMKKGMFVVENHLLEGEWKCVKQTSFAAG